MRRRLKAKKNRVWRRTECGEESSVEKNVIEIVIFIVVLIILINRCDIELQDSMQLKEFRFESVQIHFQRCFESSWRLGLAMALDLQEC